MLTIMHRLADVYVIESRGSDVLAFIQRRKYSSASLTVSSIRGMEMSNSWRLVDVSGVIIRSIGAALKSSSEKKMIIQLIIGFTIISTRTSGNFQ